MCRLGKRSLMACFEEEQAQGLADHTVNNCMQQLSTLKRKSGNAATQGPVIDRIDRKRHPWQLD